MGSVQGTERHVVLLYGPTWDAPSQVSKHHMARYWASRGYKVLYVEAPFHLLSVLTRAQEVRHMWRRFATGPKQVASNLWVQAFPVLYPYRAGWPLARVNGLLGLNQLIVRLGLTGTLKRLAFRRPLLVVGSAIAVPWLDSLKPSLVLYHCSDDYTRQPTFPVSYGALERALTSRADLVVCTAETLRKAKAPLNPHTFTVTNGADVTHFAHTQAPGTKVPEELATLPRPVVGYVGTVFQWLDQEMIGTAAARLPSWSFVLIGPVTTNVDRLKRFSNIYLLGPRPYATLPSYLKGFDIATVPFIFHDVTLRASPVKFYEYLAAGVPIVATRLPNFEPFGHLATLVSSPAEFAQALEAAVQSETPAKRAARMAEARNHSWSARFAQIDRLIDEAYQRNSRGQMERARR